MESRRQVEDGTGVQRGHAHKIDTFGIIYMVFIEVRAGASERRLGTARAQT